MDSFPHRACSRKYLSEIGDLVIGRVLQRKGEFYHLDIGDRFPAILQYYDFQGATKRNRPYLENGTLVYGRIKEKAGASNAILTCVSTHNKKSWSSGEAQFMELKGGYLEDVPITVCQRLLREQEILESIGRRFAFQVTVGFNGKIWVNSGHPLNTILIINVLKSIENKNIEEIRALVDVVRREAVY